MPPRAAIARAFALRDRQALLRLAHGRPSRVLRYLHSRLFSADPLEKSAALDAMGALLQQPELVSHAKALDLLRRFLWALNDESGAVPFGMPEGIGEVLAVRPELQEEFLPILCSFLTEEEMLQTGPVERGVMWALGRVGSPAARCCPQAMSELALAAREHEDPETRRTAREARRRIGI